MRKLSGGQLQRARFARLCLEDASLILLDEPFLGVDGATLIDLMALIARWHAESRTILIVLHDFELMRAHIPETLLLARRVIAWGPTREVLAPEPLCSAQRAAQAFTGPVRHAPARHADAIGAGLPLSGRAA